MIPATALAPFLVVVLGLAPAAAAAGPEGAGARVARVLLQPGAELDEPEIARDLAALGVDVVPVLLLCAAGEVHGALPEGALGDGTRLAIRPDRIPAVAVKALGSLPNDAVLDELAVHLTANRSLDARTAAARILAEVAAVEGVDLALALLREASDTELCAPSVRGPLRDALTAPLRAHARALGRIDLGLAGLDQARLLLVVEALDAAQRGDAAGLLAALLKRDPALAPELLTALGSVAERRPFEAERELDLASLLPPFLADPRPAVRAAAARAAGRAHVGQVAWALVDRLGEDSAEVRASARSALRAMAGVDHGYDVSAWSLVVEVERRWLENGGLEQALAEIAGADLSAAASALLRLADHRLSRRAIGAALGDLLADLPGPTARTAAATLADLDARSAVPGLVRLLDGAVDAETLGAAHAALTRLTGAELAAEPAAWRMWLERSALP